jgi:hypothetical protein
MIIYNPNNLAILKERIIEAQNILDSIPARSTFITGSFLFNEQYKDIDVFVITRSNKPITHKNPKVKVTLLQFSKLHSLFYHSISKFCISKNILPTKTLRITTSDYWNIVNEIIPTIFNQKNKFHKDIRYLILYTEYLITSNILDTYALTTKLKNFKSYKDVLEYIKTNVPKAIATSVTKEYIKRFFYTKAGYYKDTLKYESHKYLYNLTHDVIREAYAHG